MNNNDISRLKLSNEFLGPNEGNIDNPPNIRRKDTFGTNSIRTNNEFTPYNQFTLSTFNTFKTNKATLLKNDQLLPSSHKDNLGYLTKNYWTNDLKGNASPTRLNKLNVPSKLKAFSNSNSSKTLNKLK